MDINDATSYLLDGTTAMVVQSLQIWVFGGQCHSCGDFKFGRAQVMEVITLGEVEANQDILWVR